MLSLSQLRSRLLGVLMVVAVAAVTTVVEVVLLLLLPWLSPSLMSPSSSS